MNKIPYILACILIFASSLSGYGETISIIQPCADTVFIDLLPEEYPISKEELPRYKTSVKIGSVKANANFYISIDYPEFQNLKPNEMKWLKGKAQEIGEKIKVEKHLGFSRKEGYLDISFCPIIKDNGTFKRLISCKLNIKTDGMLSRTLSLPQTYASSDQRWKNESVLSKGKWAKLRVKKEGIYTLTPSFLAKMGFNDPSKVKLFGYGGRILEENWKFSGSQKVTDDLEEVPLYRKSNGNALFFAEGTIRWTFNSSFNRWTHENNPYSKYSYYFITEGEKPAVLEQVQSERTTSTTISTIPYYTIIDQDAFGWYEGGREMYDSYDFAYGNSKTYKLTAHSLDEKANRSTVEVSFSASSKTSTTKVAVSHNSKQLGVMNIPKYSDFQSAYEIRQAFNSTISEENQIQLKVSPSNPAHLNFIRINYNRKLTANDAPYSFCPNKSRNVQLNIADATESNRLWCIGNGEHPVYEVKGTLADNVLKAKVENGMDRFVVVDLNESYPTPEWDGKVDNQNLHGDLKPYDMVIIIPESRKLEEEAERLAEAHRKMQNLRVKVVDAGQIFNEFSSGTPDASAYRRYLKMLYDRAESNKDLPQYLLLFGDCAWDNRMISEKWSSYSPKDFLLSFEVTDGYNNLLNSQFALGEQDSYVTDDYFGWLDDNEGSAYSSNKLDLSIGRFTCHTPNTAKVLVDKSIKYLDNKETGSWKNVIYVLADDGNGNLHMNDAEAVVKQIEQSTYKKSLIKKVYNDAFTRVSTGTGHSFPTVTPILKEAIKQGALIFNYTGHGNPDQLSHSKILKTKDFEEPTLGNMPLWIMASCEISPFDSQQHDLGRAAIHNANGGAIAVMCAARTVYSNYNRNLNIAYNKHLFALDISGKRNTMGDALRLAKVEMLGNANGSNIKDASINKLKYVLLGDPALPITFPVGNVKLDSINGQKISPNDKIQLKAGSLVRFSGQITDRLSAFLPDFNGSITATISDRTEKIVCKNNDGSADEPMVYLDRTKKIYEGSDFVKNGKFSISFRIPKDISYSDDNARVTFYAVNKDKTMECNGANEQFYLNGTDNSLAPDTLSPKVYVYLNHPEFQNGGVTSKEPIFFAEIKDDAGINATGIGIGHHIELVIDEDYNNPIVLNNYFNYKFGSYNEGAVTYQLNNLANGKHTLSFKVWDINGNSTTSKLEFYIQEGVQQNFDVYASQNPARTSTNLVTTFLPSEDEGSTAYFEVYNINGQKIWQSETLNIPAGAGYGLVQWNLTYSGGARVNAGIYLYRAVVKTAGHQHESDAKKIIVLAQ